nr:multidrug resistance-associated protein 4-like [Leptinotarsa decemlineata]
MNRGKARGSLLYHYISSGMKSYQMIFLFLLMCVAQGSNNMLDWFVTFWTNVEENKNVGQNDFPMYYKNWATETYIYIYGGIATFCLITTLSRSILFHRFLLSCSSNLHTSVFESIIHTSLRFFEANPAGKILNRLSKDINVIDETLPKILFNASRIFLKMVGHLVIVMYVNPFIIILVAILGFVFTRIRNIYLKTSTCLKRLEAKNLSPVFTHLTSTMQGLTTIRAHKAEDILKEEFDRHQDNHTCAWFMLISTSSAFGFALDLICHTFICSLIFGLLSLSDCE